MFEQGLGIGSEPGDDLASLIVTDEAGRLLSADEAVVLAENMVFAGSKVDRSAAGERCRDPNAQAGNEGWEREPFTSDATEPNSDSSASWDRSGDPLGSAALW